MADAGDLFGFPGTPGDYAMRAPCPACGHGLGRVETRNGQDVVRCAKCDRWCYNAPRVETGRAVRSVSSVHNGIKPKQRARLIQRANGRCELCGSRDDLHASHVLSVADGLAAGLTEHDLNDDENLVVSCAQCNLGFGSETLPTRLLVAILRARIACRLRAEEDRKRR